VANTASFEAGWLRRGDLARQNADGTLTITGRLKLLIEVGGYKIDPLEVEAALLQHPAVAEAVVVGVRDGSYGGPRLKGGIAAPDAVDAHGLTRPLRHRPSSHKVPPPCSIPAPGCRRAAPARSCAAASTDRPMPLPSAGTDRAAPSTPRA